MSTSGGGRGQLEREPPDCTCGRRGIGCRACLIRYAIFCRNADGRLTLAELPMSVDYRHRLEDLAELVRLDLLDLSAEGDAKAERNAWFTELGRAGRRLLWPE